MHSNVLESKCFQLDTGMVHTYPLVTKNKRPQPKQKTKDPNQNKTKQKSIIKNAKAQQHTAGRKSPAGPQTKRAPVVCSPQGQKQGWWHNQKLQNVSETNFKAFKALSCKQQL